MSLPALFPIGYASGGAGGECHYMRPTCAAEIRRYRLFRMCRTLLATLLLSLTLLPASATVVRATHTADATDWVVQSRIPTHVPLNSAAFADETNGYVGGDNGAFYVTHTGGATWGTRVSGITEPFHMVRFFDGSRGVSVAAGSATTTASTVLTTENSGGTWTPLSLPDQNDTVSSVASPAPGVYYVLYDNLATSTLYVSTDNGANWQVLPAATDSVYAQVTVVKFVSLNEGWAYGQHYLEHTVDRGLTWQPLNLQSDVVGLWFFPGYITGFLQDSSGMYFTESTDNGATFNHMPLPQIGGTISAVAVRSPLEVMFASSNGHIYSTQDGGATWAAQTVPADGIKSVVVTSLGWRGSLPYAITDKGLFLHYGSLPATPTPIPTATATPQLVVPLPTRPLPVATPASYLRIKAVAPTAVVTHANATVTLLGIGFDSLATVSIGDDDIIDNTFTASTRGPGMTGALRSLSFVLPGDLGPGVYDVTITEPDGRSATLAHALTVLLKLMVHAHLLHATVTQGTTAVVLLQTQADATISVTVASASGHPLPHLKIALQKGVHGAWRALVPINLHTAPGMYKITITATKASQAAQQVIGLSVRASK